MNIKQYITDNFNGYNISIPAFYQWDIGLRFSLSPSELYQFKGEFNYSYNEEYFNVVSKRATELFNFAMDSEDEILIVLQSPCPNKERIRKFNYLFKQIEHLDYSKIKYKTLKGLYNPNLFCHTYKRAIIATKVKNVNIQNIVEAISNHDLPDRKPQIYGEVFFVNLTKHIILNMYDDRGLDIISTRKETLSNLYKQHNDWILDYDRKKIDSIFKQKSG